MTSESENELLAMTIPLAIVLDGKVQRGSRVVEGGCRTYLTLPMMVITTA